MTWTEQNVETLRRMWEVEGASATEIAQALGNTVTRSAVIGKAHRLKLPGRESVIRPRQTPPPKKRERGHPQVKAIVAKVTARKAIPDEVNLPGEREEGVDVTHLIGLHHLTNNTCRWPVSGSGSSTMFCGDPVAEGSRYCTRHHRRAYIRI